MCCFQALDDINVLMRTEKNTVRKRLLAEETSAASDQNGGVTYVTASGEIISASDLVTAADGAGPDTKRFIVPAAGAATTNMQVLHVINSSGTSTAVNTKLESILDDRSQ